MKRIAILVAALLAVVLVGAAGWWCTRRDGATWSLVQGQQVTTGTTSVQVRIAGSRCGGQPLDTSDATVDLRPDRMVVTYSVTSPRGLWGNAACVAVNDVRTLTLPEPLGHRMLVDGTCPAYEPAGNPRCVRVPAP